MKNKDLIGKTFRDHDELYEFEVTAESVSPGYVDLTRTTLATGATRETCQPAVYVRERVKATT